MNGTYKRYYPANTHGLIQQQYEKNYFNGVKHGKQEYWYKNGQKQLDLLYVNGKLEGRQIAWWKDGTKRFDYIENPQRRLSRDYWYNRWNIFQGKEFRDGREVYREKLINDLQSLY